MPKKNKIIIIGAGPGGLAAGMLLGSRGFNVEIYEKDSQPGGRTSEINLDGYHFDVGPTFFMMKFILDEIFYESGRKSEDYLKFIRLTPMYRLIMPDDRYIDSYEDREKMRAELKRVFPGEENGIDQFYEREKKRYERLMPILQKDNNNIAGALSPNIFRGLPYFSVGKSVFDEMGKYFSEDLAKLTFTFQSKYLGMSPWECPGAFGLVPYVEHAFGIYHVIGGLSEISRQMAKVCEELGVKINYNTKVKKIITENRVARGIELETGDRIDASEVINNTDFGYMAQNLLDQKNLNKYSKDNLSKKKISCSIFMLYLGLKKQYKLNHNTIVFARDYKKNVNDVFGGRLSGKDISFYVRDHSTTDPTLAPEGKTALYVLVPVPNLRANINWQENIRQLRDFAIQGLKERLDMKDIEENIEVEKIHTPKTWQEDYNVYQGAVFNLAHNLGQMLWFRPHNDFEEVDNLYLTGGGTHPGSGLPTIYESGRIACRLICKKHGVNYKL